MTDFELEFIAQLKHYLDTMIHYYSLPMNYDKASQEYESKGMYTAFINIKCFIEYLESFYNPYIKEESHNDQI